MTKAPGARVGVGRVLSWGLFDFANTIFPANILSLYFALWVTVDHGAEDIVYSLAVSGSMLLVATVSPMLGSISARYVRRTSFLVFFKLVSVAFTAAIGQVGGLTAALFLFAVAVIFSPPAFWVIGALSGVALGGTWTSDLVSSTRLASPRAARRVLRALPCRPAPGRRRSAPHLGGAPSSSLLAWGPCDSA